MFRMNVRSLNDLENITKQSDTDLVIFLQNLNLLKKDMKCNTRNCRRKCIVVRKQGCSSLNYAFYCKSCKKFYSILKKSFFEKIKVPVRDILKIMWLWACETRSGVSQMIMGTSKKRIIQVYRYFRDITSWKIIKEEELFVFGKNSYIF